ncbi:MAG: site-2 protease family protein, partial [Muribaculaceae bacterium]|nr:site-2 protease family protein [Muribaculaceae bacterium]
MEAFLIKALQLIVALSLLVVIHEFGHYIFARMFGIKVEKFYLFFNPWFSLAKWKPKPPKRRRLNRDGSERASWRDTVYGIGWLPLGGYVKIAGMIDESMDTEQMASEPQPWEFRSKPAYQRLLVMLAGVIFNFLLAIVIYAGIAFYWGEKVIPLQEATEGMNYSQALKDAGFQDGDILLTLDGKPIDVAKGSIEWDLIQDGAAIDVLRNHTERLTITLPSGTTSKIIAENRMPIEYRFPTYVADVVAEPAKSAGLLPGDRIIKIGADSTPAYSDMQKSLARYAGKPTTITVMRADSIATLNATPTATGKLGFHFVPPTELFKTEVREYGIFESLPRGWELGVDQLSMYVSSLKHVFTKDGAEQVGGFGAIGS